MKVALIDVDSKIPNLALMKISSYHKAKGDEVKFYDPLFDSPDICYASKIFDFTPDYEYFPECKVIKGGPGYDVRSKLEIPNYDKIMPDYSLYGCDYAMGRFTRGCPNSCQWCIVPKMDGNKVTKVADLKDFWCGQKVVRLLDDNIMADEQIFIDSCRQLAEAKVKVIWEALDIRKVNEKTANALASVRQSKSIHFAWDGKSQDSSIEKGIECLKNAGIKPYRLMFYILVGFNTTKEYDLFRIYKIRNLGANPFVMPFNKSDKYQKDLARWCNNKFIFKSCSRFEDYCK